MLKHFIFLSLFVSFIYYPSFSQLNPNVPLDCFDNGHLSKQLALKVTEGFATDSLKIVAIYSWIVENISYDSVLSEQIANPLYWRKNNTALDLNNMKPLYDCAEILTTKKTICLGYAHLFSSMCNNVGIKNAIVRGFARFDSLSVDLPNHAWVSFKLGHKWYLADPTWDANIYMPEAEISDKNPYFFLMTDPEVFLASHFPLDPLWQFRTSLLSLKSWNAYIDDSNPATSYFHYADSLKQYESNTIEKNFLSSMNRVIIAKDFPFLGHLEHYNFLKKPMVEEIIYYSNLTQKLNNGNKNIEEMAQKILPRKKELFTRLSRIESYIERYKYHLVKLQQLNNPFKDFFSVNQITADINDIKTYSDYLKEERMSLESTINQLESMEKKPTVVKKIPR